MGKSVVGRSTGMPDFSVETPYPTKSIRSLKGSQFTEVLAKNGSEDENVAGMLSSKVIIRNLSIHANQQLHFRLEFYTKDTFDDVDLDVDTFVGAVDLDLTEYGVLS